LRYREDIRIGEDHDFYMRFLLNGGKLHLLPQSYYLYRRHTQSLSHRMHPDDVRAMIAVQDDLLKLYQDLPTELRADFAARRTALQKPLAFETLVQNLKTHRFGHAFLDVVRKPALLLKLGQVASSHLFHRFKKPAPSRSTFSEDLDKWTVQNRAAFSSPEVS
jgi:succinoglycan biosynthesis protein ExoO